MSTTSQTHGGGAQPASIDTSGKVTGGAALRVYGFDSEADAQAAGFVCEGGPAMSVSLITDAQIASGEWKLEGDPSGLAVYTAPSNMPVEGGFAVPVYPINGWGSAPAPVAPLFVSAEVGTVNVSTVAVTFDQDVSASDYSTGVTIKVNGTGATISSTTRQSNHAIVYYVLSAAVVFGDVVTWEYAEASGNIVAEDDSTPLEDVSAQGVTNNVADTIGDGLRADAIAYYKFDSTVADATGRGNTLSNAGPVGFAAGKISQAAHFTNTSGEALTIDSSNTDFNTDQTTKSFVIAGWVKLWGDNSYGQYMIVQKYDQVSAGAEFLMYYQPSLGKWFAGSIDQVQVEWTQDANWHFIVLYYIPNVNVAPNSSQVGFSIDHGAFQTLDLVPNLANQVAITYFGSDQFDTVSALDLDELLFLKRTNPASPTVLTSDEIDYLYNSGAGRTLYP